MKIEGYFRTIKEANDAVEKLKSAGFNNAYSDINDHYISDRNTQINLAGTSTSTSLSELVMKSGEEILDNSITPLSAADPMVSGMAGFEEVADINSKVVVEVTSNNIQEAKNIIENNGGILYNPNPNRPKGLENVEINSKF
jgi:hypothetical protein